MTWFQLIRRFWSPAALPQRPRPIVPVDPERKAAIADDLLRRHNAERLRAGVRELTLSDVLTREAQAWAETMAANGSMVHSQIGRLVQLHGRVAENIAQGQPTTSHVMIDWMNSPGHRANLLGPYRVAGFGECAGFWCAIFGEQ